MAFHVTPNFASVIGLSPSVALLVTVVFIGFLFRRDIRGAPDVTGALWIPLVWMFLAFSRAPSVWLAILGFPGLGAASVEEGSPLDACFYFALVVAGVFVLTNRQVTIAEVFRSNTWLIVFLLYCFVAIFWSDFPYVAFKRWIKVLGHPVMALLVITEPNPQQAIKTLMKRCAYLAVPLSILFIKYYPEWGRSFDEWSGMPMNIGIAQGKNMLGANCFILGLFFLWYLLYTWRLPRDKARRSELFLIGGFICMIWWLLRMAHSSTSVISLLLGAALVLLLRGRFAKTSFIGTYILAGIALIGIAEMTFGISGYIAAAMGKDPTLTGRTELWQQLFGFDTNPIFGVGFESFWLGDRTRRFVELYRWHANEAHNGYLEIYLNLGLLGLFLFIAVFIATFWKIRRELWQNSEWARFELAFFTAVMVYNWTEAGFKALHPVCFVFYIIAVNYPSSTVLREDQPLEVGHSAEDEELVYAERFGQLKGTV